MRPVASASSGGSIMPDTAPLPSAPDTNPGPNSQPSPSRRLHIGLRVADIEKSIAFYTRLFGQPPTLRRPDYAKWMLDDPYANVSLIERDGPHGLHHVGIQLDDGAALDEFRGRMADGDVEMAHQDALTCGYQVQDKSWVIDPDGVNWEHFFTHGLADSFGETTEQDASVVALREKAADTRRGDAGGPPKD
jgi:catechol 2,3-dioxygenase-like lactoylglutathione lyase family enzyme